MNMIKKHNILQAAKVAILGLILGLGVTYLYAWSGPQGTAPNLNVGAPINVTNIAQEKIGGLILNSGGATNGLIVSSGRVGIGTASPANKLQVISGDNVSTTNILEVRSNNLSQSLGLTYERVKGNFGLGMDSGAAQPLYFYINGVEKMRVNTDGNVGIGEPAPASKLEVRQSSTGTGFGGTSGTGAIRVSWNTGYGVGLDAWDGGAPRWGIVKYTADTPMVVMEGQYNLPHVIFNAPGGNVGIGVTAPAQKLDVNGNIKTGGIMVTNGAAAGKVLTATDALGNTAWADPAAGSILSGSFTVTAPGNTIISSGVSSLYTATVTGAAVGDTVVIGYPSNYYYGATNTGGPTGIVSPAGYEYYNGQGNSYDVRVNLCGTATATVSSANTVKINFWNNYGSTSCTIPAGTYKIKILK